MTQQQQSTPMVYSPLTGHRFPAGNPPVTSRNYREESPKTMWIFNPWTGALRTKIYIDSDPQGRLIIPPGEPLYADTSDGWIEWKGGERPVPKDTLVQVRIKGSEKDQDPVAAGTWHWSWTGSSTIGCVIAYKVVEAETSPLDKAGLGDSQEMLTFGSLAKQDGNTDANGEGKQTNPKDLIGARKAKFSVIPAGVLFDVGNAMTEGMVKYGRHNYRHAGIRASVYYDAAMGHQADWWEGQDIDPESGLSHITKAIASLVVLRDAMLQGMMTDDRPPRSKVFKPDFSPTTAEIIDRHKDKNPRHFTIADSKEAA